MNKAAAARVIIGARQIVTPPRKLGTPTILMNANLFLRLGLALAASIVFTHCASTPQTRIAKNPQLFSQLGAKDRELVAQGVIREGMVRDAVFLAWGRPDSVSVGTNRGRETESWTYVGQRPVRTMNMNMGFGFGGMSPWGWGPYGWGGGPFSYWGGGPAVTYIPYTAGVVEFSRGRVARWEATSR